MTSIEWNNQENVSGILDAGCRGISLSRQTSADTLDCPISPFLDMMES